MADGELLLFVARRQLSIRLQVADARHEGLPSALTVMTHAIWFYVNVVGITYTVREPDVRLLLLSTLLPLGFVASRWQASPRCAMLFTLTAMRRPVHWRLVLAIATMSSMVWIVPRGAVTSYVLMGLTQATLVSALRAEQANIRRSMSDLPTDLPNRLLLQERLDLLFDLRRAINRTASSQ